MSFVKKKLMKLCNAQPTPNGMGYSTLSANIIRFSELNRLPIPMDLSRLDEGKGIEATFMEQVAKWLKLSYKVQQYETEKSRKKSSIPRRQ